MRAPVLQAAAPGGPTRYAVSSVTRRPDLTNNNNAIVAFRGIPPMSMTPGSRFGAFEIAEAIGAGGMGEVYRATDTSLKREVAIKVLPAAFVEDTDRLARFQREAEILASLNHPNIAQVYGLEHEGGVTAIVMELVEGPTLADRIKQGPIAPDEAMGIAMQVVSALEAAHEKQIVHRDLKPANIKVRDDGTVKVLDFGISKPVDARTISGASPVMTTPAVTETGVILGTAAYMSPEQARGKFVDERTDIWAFGCLLFEMLTGQPAFGGEDVMLTLARVLDRATDMSSIPQTISPTVRHTLELCLEKDPKKRIADIRDVRLALEGTFETSIPHAAEAPTALPFWRRALVPAISLLAGGLLVVLFALALEQDPEPKRITRFFHVVPDNQNLARATVRYFDLSADGSRFIYTTTAGIYKREMDELEATLIAGTDDSIPVVAVLGPESDEVFFSRIGGGLNRISIEGGVAAPAQRQAPSDALPNVETSIWAPEGHRIVSYRGGISLVRMPGGEDEPLITLDDGQLANGARLLPDGDTLLYALRDADVAVNNSRIVAQSIASGDVTNVLPRGYYPRYLDTGHLLYVLDGLVHAVAFDPESLAVLGRDRVVLSDVSLGASGLPQYQLADNGTLAYVQAPPATISANEAPGMRLAWLYLDTGRLDWLPIEAVPAYMRLSPSGDRLALSTELIADAGNDVYVYELDRPGSPTRVARTEANEMRPFWMRDSRQVIYERFGPGGGLFRQSANGTDLPERLTTRPDPYVSSVAHWISPDDQTLVFERAGPDSGTGLYTLDLDDLTVDTLIDDPDILETGFAMSPDMRFIAIATDESGIPEIHIRPYPDWQSDNRTVSAGGGTEPAWDPAGFVYYLNPDGYLMRVPVQMDPELEIGEPTRVSPIQLVGSRQQRPNYDFDPVGRRFLIRQFQGASAGEVAENKVVVVENWIEWLKREVLPD
jgi:hypothetical protein